MKKIFTGILLSLLLYVSASAMTLYDIRTQIRYDINDTTDTVNINTRFSDTILNARINMVQDYVVTYTKCLYGRQTITPSTDVQEYLLPSDCDVVDRVAFIWVANSTTTYKRLTGRTIPGLDNEIPLWENTGSGVPRFYYRRANFIGLYPKPSSTYAQSGALKIDYFQRPAEMVNDSDTPYNGDTALNKFAELIVMGVDIMCRSTMGEETASIEARYKFTLDMMKDYCKFRYSNDVNENIQIVK